MKTAFIRIFAFLTAAVIVSSANTINFEEHSYDSAVTVSAASSLNNLVPKAEKIIFNNEGGYDSVLKKDGSALSVGKIQWNAERAHTLLRKIVEANRSNAEKILGSSLYNEILGKSSWTKRTLNDSEATCIKKLLATDESKKIQDNQAFSDVSGYIKNGLNKGLSEDAALIYYADLRNQRPVSSDNILNNAKNAAGSYSSVTLDILHYYAERDKYIGIKAYSGQNFDSRRKYTYASCQKLEKKVNVKFLRNFSGDDTTSVTETFIEGIAGQRFGYMTNGKGKYEYMCAANVGFGKWNRGENYELLGWSTSRNATLPEYKTYSSVSDSWISSNSSVNLYAVWQSKIKASSPSLSPSTDAVITESPEILNSQIVGDLNCDGKVDISDLSTLSVYIIGDIRLDGKCLKNADTNLDGTVDLADLANLRRFISKVQEYLTTEVWVAEDNVPDGAEVIDEMWRYDTVNVEKTESEAETPEGWTKTGSRWVTVSEGTSLQAEFPEGYDKSSAEYKKYSTDKLESFETENTKRVVSDSSVNRYIYWHFCYRLESYGALANRLISDIRTDKYSEFSSVESTVNYTESPEPGVFKFDTKKPEHVSYWWYKIPVIEHKYTDYKLVNEYTRTTVSENESYTDPTGLENAENIKKFVKIRLY